MIHLENVGKIYRTKTIETLALDNIHLSVDKGEFISVMGPSGCGKSTLLNLIGLLDDPSSGSIIIDNQSMSNLSEKEKAALRNQKIGFVFQNFHLIYDLPVVDNVEIPLLYRKVSGRMRRKMALEALEKVGLAARTHHYPGQLSGGQCQRVAIARAIVGNQKVILADEPTGNLDSEMGNEIFKILTDMNEKTQTTIIMVTHNEGLAKRTQRTIRLFDGCQVN
jgi:putative ABC transport system ATP-binding protein